MFKKVVITGGTGFIGTRLCHELVSKNYQIILLTRDPNKAKRLLGSQVLPILWDGKTATGWFEYADGADAIINLAGDNIGAGRWTQKKKKRILESRLNAGKAIVDAVSRIKNRPEVLIQASGIGIYGNRGDELLDESLPIGTGFMPDLAQRWEHSVKQLEDMKVRVVYIRTGVVIGKDGGFLRRAKLPFRFFMGGHPGKGTQWLSWIHLEDEVKAVHFLLEKKNLRGIFNLTAPNPVTAKNFFSTLGTIMKSPSWFHIPEWMLKLVLGEMAQELLLSGQRAIPKRLLEAGFTFSYPELERALQQVLAEPYNVT